MIEVEPVLYSYVVLETEASNIVSQAFFIKVARNEGAWGIAPWKQFRLDCKWPETYPAYDFECEETSRNWIYLNDLSNK